MSTSIFRLEGMARCGQAPDDLPLALSRSEYQLPDTPRTDPGVRN